MLLFPNPMSFRDLKLALRCAIHLWPFMNVIPGNDKKFVCINQWNILHCLHHLIVMAINILYKIKYVYKASSENFIYSITVGRIVKEIEVLAYVEESL